MAFARLSLGLLALLAAGCSSATFAIANLASRSEPADRVTDITYGEAERQRLDVYKPEGATASAPRPVVLFVHGGAWDSGSKDDYAFVGRRLAERGYVAVLPSYRLYPAVHFPLFVEDIAKAVAWTRAHAAEHGGDPGRIFLMGHSAGAHIVMLVALDPRYLRALGLESTAVRGVVGLSGPYDFLPFGSGFHHEVFDYPGDVENTQPVRYAHAGAPPVLLLYGSADTTVRPHDSESLAAALEAAGAPATLKRYDGASHSDTVAAFSNLKRHPLPVPEDIDAFVTRVTTQ